MLPLDFSLSLRSRLFIHTDRLNISFRYCFRRAFHYVHILEMDDSLNSHRGPGTARLLKVLGPGGYTKSNTPYKTP